MLEINHNRAPAPIVAEQVETVSRSRKSVLVYLKLVSAFLLVEAGGCWMRVIGISNSVPNRFDTMSPEWQLLMGLLCVAEPVAALGLWIGHSWGVIIWVVLVVAEAYVVFAHSTLFGVLEPTVFINLFLLAVFLVLEIAMRFIPNKRLRRTNTNP